MALSMWKVNGNQLELNPSSYLQTELGIKLKKTQDENTILAIQKPDDFIAKRSSEIDKFFADNGKVTEYFKARLAEYTKLGLPSDVAREMALRSSNRFYQEELELLELEMPGGYQRAFGIANLAHNTTIAKNELSNADAIRAYKQRKRAKKQAAKKSL